MARNVERTDEFLRSMIQMTHLVRWFPFPSELNRGEFYLLHTVFRQMKESGKDFTTPTELSEELEVTRPAISKMLNMLEEKEYIERVPDRRDRRTVYVVLTRKGRRVRERSFSELRNAADKILDTMGEEESNRFIDSLHIFFQALQQCYPQTVRGERR